ncbi:Very-short-patch-repair endonuclease [Prevotella sp. KH2C16]|nr:Very-short-patch-repair endonuclease [Prevotella sp. KH2C16]
MLPTRISNLIYSKEQRQQLRKEATPAERILWRHLQKRQVEGLKFRRQHGISLYVLDFYCPEIKLCIEADGAVHDTPEAREHDLERTRLLESNGIKVIRFRNEEIENNIEDVIQVIRKVARDRLAHAGIHPEKP